MLPISVQGGVTAPIGGAAIPIMDQQATLTLSETPPLGLSSTPVRFAVSEVRALLQVGRCPFTHLVVLLSKAVFALVRPLAACKQTHHHKALCSRLAVSRDKIHVYHLVQSQNIRNA